MSFEEKGNFGRFLAEQLLKKINVIPSVQYFLKPFAYPLNLVWR